MVALATPERRYGSPRNRQQAFDLPKPADAISRTFALVAFTSLLAFNVALSTLKVGWIPIRGIFAAGMLGLVILLYADTAKLVVRRYLPLLALAAALAILGLVVSVVNGAPQSDIVTGLTEVHLQAAVTILVTAVLAQICGGRACMYAILAVIGASAAVAAAQMMDFQAAWDFRRAFGPLRNEEISGLLNRRPMGLSFTPIQLSTQLCLAFAAFAAVRNKLHTSARLPTAADPAVIFGLVVLFAASIACATRSPILGGLIFMAAYAIQCRTVWMALFLILAAILVYMAWPILMGFIESNSPRVTKVDDNSAAARITMVYYGIRLFADHPLGYGFAFEPMNLWTSYWPDLYTMPSPEGVQVHDLHNYVLSMLNIYGVGILLLVPIAAKLLGRASGSIIFFVPYIVHISFHNSGPFYNDSVIWFVIAAVGAAGTARIEPRPDMPATGSRTSTPNRFRFARAGHVGSMQAIQPRHRSIRPMTGVNRRSSRSTG